MSITTGNLDLIRYNELIAMTVFGRGSKDNEEYEKLKTKLTKTQI